MSTEKVTFKVIKDTREQQGWEFPRGSTCLGTTVKKLLTGDYTIEEHEKEFVIERKATTGEFAKNITETRFKRELERLETFTHPFIICEFSMEDILMFPKNSGIPISRWPLLRVTSDYILKEMLRMQVEYKVKFILAGKASGYKVAWSLFKRFAEYEKKHNSSAA